MASSSSTKSTKNPGKGRRRIEIKKVEQASKRLVTFSKRKLGLFRKAAELSLLCNSDIAVVIFSQHGKVFSSGYPDPDAVIRRYLSGTFSSFSDPTSVAQDWEGESSAVSSLRREYEEAMRVLDDEKKSLNAMADIPSSGCGSGSWWNRSVREMGLEEVVEFKERVEQFRQNLVAAAEEKKKTTMATAPLVTSPTMTAASLATSSTMTTASLVTSPTMTTAPLVTSPTMTTASLVTSPPTTTEEESLYMSLLNGDGFEIDQTWDWGWDSWNEITSCNDSSMVWDGDLGQSYERLGF